MFFLLIFSSIRAYYKPITVTYFLFYYHFMMNKDIYTKNCKCKWNAF